MGAEKAEEFAKYRPHESYYYEDSGLGKHLGVSL